MNSAKWTWFAIGYQCVFAYAFALVVYQLGMLFTGNGSIIGAMAALYWLRFSCICCSGAIKRAMF